MSMWGGRFQGKTDPRFKSFNDSLPIDHRLVAEDIEASIAWAEAIEAVGVISPEQRGQIVSALGVIADEAANDPAIVTDADEEDIHSWVETRLIDMTGDVGRKLHTGRSRNDQVATDFRMWARRETIERRRELHLVQESLLRLAERERGSVLPGYTHLQPAQPVLLAHWCLAYMEMLERDDTRFADALVRLDSCPLGSGALSGTAYPIDRHALARSLGFSGPTRNSLDAVSDRDFVAELLFATALCGVHFSRLAEDLIFYLSSEAGFIELDDSMTSGSSHLPQKKNPDALELLRGKSGRLIGELMAMCTTLKGLPLAYNKDLQEDKRPLMTAMDELSQCFAVVPPVLDGLRVDRARTQERALAGYANATELADYLANCGVPFREAHDRVGKIVRQAIEARVALEDMELSALRTIAPEVDKDVFEWLTVEHTLGRRVATGGTAPPRVAEAIREARRRLETRRRETGSILGDVRPARIDDVEGIHRLVEHWADAGENLPRSREDIVEAIADFGIAEMDDMIVGCGSLYIYTTAIAEIRSLGIEPGHHGDGLGSRLVRYFIDCATHLHIPKVFVLTRAPNFFEKLGFRIESMDALPEKVFKDCAKCSKQSCCDEVPMIYHVAI